MRLLVLVRPARTWWMVLVWWMIWWMATGTKATSGTASGALVVRDQGGGPVVYLKFRHDGRQRERRVGRGWLVPAGAGLASIQPSRTAAAKMPRSAST
jgi:hypothetical protein